jgi:hypothetical protein
LPPRHFTDRASTALPGPERNIALTFLFDIAPESGSHDMWITHARPCRDGKPEPSIADMLSDPMVKAVMAADGIDPVELEAELRSIARTLATTRRTDRQH